MGRPKKVQAEDISGPVQTLSEPMFQTAPEINKSLEKLEKAHQEKPHDPKENLHLSEKSPFQSVPPKKTNMNTQSQMMAMHNMALTGLDDSTVVTNPAQITIVAGAAELSGKGYIEVSDEVFGWLTQGRKTDKVNYGNIKIYKVGTKDKIEAFEGMKIDDRLRVKEWTNLP